MAEKENIKRDSERAQDGNTTNLLLVKNERCEKAFGYLYTYYFPRVKAFLRQRGAEERAAQDVAQEVMIKVWRKAELFDETRANASTWIFTITRNHYIDAIRRERRYEIDENDPLFAKEETATAEDTMIKKCDDAALIGAISNLPDDQQKVLRLNYLEGKKQREIASELAIPLNTVKSRLRLAVERLRKALEDS